MITCDTLYMKLDQIMQKKSVYVLFCRKQRWRGRIEGSNGAYDIISLKEIVSFLRIHNDF